jgi:hypothetical protein
MDGMVTLAEYAEKVMNPYIESMLVQERTAVIRAAFVKLKLPEEAYAAFELGFMAGVSLMIDDNK